MILSLLQSGALILAMILLLGALAVPAGAIPEGNEIVLREDGLLQSSISSLVAGVGATACVALVFVIVWKQWEL